MSALSFEEESFDDEPEPVARSGDNVVQPESYENASQISISSNLSGKSAGSQKRKPKNTELDILVQSTLEKRPSTITVTQMNKKAIDEALESGDFNQMLNQATIMITNLSLQFATIKNKIDANEAIIAKVQKTHFEQTGSKIKY